MAAVIAHCSLVIIALCTVRTFALASGGRARRSNFNNVFKQQRSDKLQDYGNIEIWPLPSNATLVTNAHLDPGNFSIILQPENSLFLQELSHRFMPLIFFQNGTAPPQSGWPVLTRLYVTVSDPSTAVPQQDTDESYSLTISPDGQAAYVTATTVFGARHGMESFSQLVSADRMTGVYSISAMNISDAPRFPFRGLLVDTARHWLPPNLLLLIMDGQSYHKMNTLQVGFGIDWSWTVVSDAYPNLTNTSYGPQGTHIYSRDTVRWLVQEAAYRGIRLIPYFEVAGHDALGYAVPQLMCCNSVCGKGGLPHPLHNETWQFFDSLWADYKAIFPEDYMNIGGDEFDYSCWTNDTEINAWMKARGYTDISYIISYYYAQQIASLKRAGFKPLFFAEAFGPLNGTGVDLTGTDVIFDGWDTGTPGSTAPILEAPGTKVIISSYCFLAPTNSCPDNLPGGLTPNWDTNIQCEIQKASLFPASARPYLDKIVGGHPSRWGEQTDGTNIFTVTWPAVMGAAEKLWSPLALTNGSYFGSRQEVFADHRCVLIRRGLPVQPTSAYSWSCPYEWEPAYPPLTPLHPNPINSSWVTPYTAYSSTASPTPAQDVSDGPGQADGLAGLRLALADAQARVRQLERQLESAGLPIPQHVSE